MSSIVGKIKEMSDTQTFSSGFSKREIVVTTEEKFPQDIKIEFMKERADALSSYKVGDEVSVEYNLRGSEYQGRYFVNVLGWKIEKTQKGSPEKKSEPTSAKPSQKAPKEKPPVDDFEDSPF